MNLFPDLPLYKPASVTFVKRVNLPGYCVVCRVYIECAAGEAPVMSLEFGAPATAPDVLSRTPALSLEQWNAMREAMAEAWAQLSVLCRCGHPFRGHANRSPHECLQEKCTIACARFSAAEPLLQAEELEKHGIAPAAFASAERSRRAHRSK